MGTALALCGSSVALIRKVCHALLGRLGRSLGLLWQVLLLVSRRFLGGKKSSFSSSTACTGTEPLEEASNDSPLPEPIRTGEASEVSYSIVEGGETISVANAFTSLDHTVGARSVSDNGTESSWQTYEESLTSRPESPDISHLLCDLPMEASRYTLESNDLPEVVEMENVTIAPLTRTFQDPNPPGDWKRLIHPEGALYYYDEDKMIYTDSDLLDPVIYARLMQDVACIEAAVARRGDAIPHNRVIVIEVIYDDDSSHDKISTFYYLVDHTNRSIFYLHEMTVERLVTHDGAKAKSLSNLGYAVASEYWWFVYMFPDSISLSTSLISELRDILLFSIGDVTYKKEKSFSSHTLEDLRQFLSLTSSMIDNVGEGLTSLGTICLLARLLHAFEDSRFLDSYGTPAVPSEREIDDTPPSLVMRVIFWCLFSAPNVNLRDIRTMTREAVIYSQWETWMQKMTNEWTEFVAFGTILLNSNVAFLGIQSVDSYMDRNRSPVQIASYLSIIASIGSITLGLVFIRQNRGRTAEEDSEIFVNMTVLEEEVTSALYSLPGVLMIWSMLFFFTAFCLQCLLSSGTYTRAIVAPTAGAVVLLVLWSIFNTWKSESGDLLSDVRDLLTRFVPTLPAKFTSPFQTLIPKQVKSRSSPDGMRPPSRALTLFPTGSAVSMQGSQNV